MKSDNSLAMSQSGNGQTIVLLHGWGMNRRLFGTLADTLSRNFQVITIDLPGHGASKPVCPLTLNDVAHQLLAQIDGRCHWLGWSLGGSVLMHMAHIAPEKFESLVLMAASPCFVNKEGWCHGVDAGVFSEFEQTLQLHPEKTLKRFAALQVLHSDNSKATLKLLNESLSKNLPDQQSLEQGLQALLQQDQRDVFHGWTIPMLAILGERDALVPVSIDAFYRQWVPQSRIHVIAGAGHAPFLSHVASTSALIESFLLQQTDKVPAHG